MTRRLGFLLFFLLLWQPAADAQRISPSGGGTTLNGLTSDGTALYPDANDGRALGTAANSWSDLFLASGAVINFNNGDVTITHSADALTVAGGRWLLPLGSAAAPAVASSGDLDTGIYFTGGNEIGFSVAGALAWYIDGSGHLLANADNTRDIGASGATRPRTGYFGTSIIAPTVTASTRLTLTAFTFANIATNLAANGDVGYCSDCTIANPCAGSGTGAIAKRLNGVNVCN